MKISAIIITLNEQDHIQACMESLSFCDEIIVVDSGSTDETTTLAQDLGAKVLIQPWLGYKEQKAFATSHTQYDWVFSIDADERATPALAQEIEAFKLKPPLHQAYEVARQTHHSGQWIRGGGWYPNRVVRFFHKAHGQWVGNELHEKWQTQASQGVLEHDLLHFSFKNVSDQVLRNNHYSTLGAKALFQEGKRFSYSKLVIKPVIKFFETYCLKRGFLDGGLGFVISVSAAYSVFLKWWKVKELESSS